MSSLVASRLIISKPLLTQILSTICSIQRILTWVVSSNVHWSVFSVAVAAASFLGGVKLKAPAASKKQKVLLNIFKTYFKHNELHLSNIINVA